MQKKIQETENQIRKVTFRKNQKKRWARESPNLLLTAYCSTFQTTAARSPPIVGATQNSQS
jgi:hypothetical protein